jgi:hypothetical protein
VANSGWDGPKGHLRIRSKDRTVTGIFAVGPDGEEFEIEGIQDADISLSLDAKEINRLTITAIVQDADVVTMHSPKIR